MTWGLENGQFSIASLVSRATAVPFGWLALELDDFDNAARWSSFKAACDSARILGGSWFSVGGNIADTPRDARFTIGQVEGASDREGVVAAITSLPRVPKAIVTNFGGLTRPDGSPDLAAAGPLVEAGFACLTECDTGVNPLATVERQDFEARQRGFTKVQPVVYLEAQTLADYPMLSPGWSAWSAEYVL